MVAVQDRSKNNLSTLTQWVTSSNRSRDIAIIFLIVIGVLYFRRPDAFYNAQFYDEDGTSLFLGYETNGIKSIFTLSQYFVLIPHMIAVFFGVLSINFAYIPLCYNLTSCVICLLVAMQLWESANYLNLKNKILYATCFVLVPVGPDVFMNVIDSSCILYLYLIDFLFVGHKYGNKYLKLIVVFFISFSGPFGLIILPLVALILYSDRKKMSWYMISACLMIMISGIIAFFTTMQTDIRHRSRVQVNPSFAKPPEHFHLIKVFTNNINDIFLLHSHIFTKLPHIVNLIICILVTLFVAGFLIFSYIKVQTPKKYVIVLSAILFFGSYIVAFWPNESKQTVFTCARYYDLPITCMAWLIILAWDQKIKLWHIGLYVVFFLKQYQNMRSHFYDFHWKKQVQEYYEGKRNTFEINEGGKDWGWKFDLPSGK
jgi:hypothetical protein